MPTPCRLRLLAGATAPPSPALAPLLVTLYAAAGLPRFAARRGGELRRSSLGELVHQRWLNMVMEYPDIGFGPHGVHPDRLEALLHLSDCGQPRRVVRGLVAHFKALVSRDAPGERPVWAPGYALVVAASANGISMVIPSRAMTVSGKIAPASASSSGASRE